MQENQYSRKTSWPTLDRLYHTPFEFKAATALGISVAADILDYVGAPIFALPVIGDVADVFVSGLLYSITKSKKAAAINAIEFIPVIGDFIPAYTISTLLWIRQELSKRKKTQEQIRNVAITTAVQKPILGKSMTNGAGKKEENGNSNTLHDFGDNRFLAFKEDQKMRRLVTSRYSSWKAGKWQ